MKKIVIILAVVLAIGCIGIMTVKNRPIISSSVKTSRLIADTVVPRMEDCYIDVFGCAAGDGDFAEVIQRLDSAATPESNYTLMNEELHKRLYDVHGTMLKWSVVDVDGMYANYALVDFNADAKWDFALKTLTESPEQDVFFYCLPEDADPTRGIRVIVSDKESQAEPNDRSIASIVGIVTVDGVDIYLASKAREFNCTPIHATQDVGPLIEASLGAA